MRMIRERISKRLKSALQLVRIFGAALVVLLYYLGYYDLSFLDRYKDQLDLLRAGAPFFSLIMALAVIQ